MNCPIHIQLVDTIDEMIILSKRSERYLNDICVMEQCEKQITNSASRGEFSTIFEPGKAKVGRYLKQLHENGFNIYRIKDVGVKRYEINWK